MSKKVSANQRVIKLLNYIIDHRVVDSQSELSEKLGISKQYLNQIINNRVRPSKNVYDLILSLYSKELEIMESGDKPLVTEAHEEIIKYNAKSKASTYKRMIPVVHYRAQAGFSEGWSDQEWIDDLPTVEVEWPRDGNYLAFEVTGDSMECDCKKNISDRDIVIAREVARHHWVNKLHIPDTFVIVQRMDGILVKEIIKHDVGKGVIMCHSNNALFQDFSLSLEDVEKLYHVKEVRRRW